MRPCTNIGLTTGNTTVLTQDRSAIRRIVVRKLPKVGDKVLIECYTSMGTGGKEKVTKITTKYNENTGKPYKVIWFGSHGFSAKTGEAITPPTMYYINMGR